MTLTDSGAGTDVVVPLTDDDERRRFDWRAYLARYPDLVAAGIACEEDAFRHWANYGRTEGRVGLRTEFGGRWRLGCSSIHSLYLRATGHLVCWEDAGNDTVLQRYDQSTDYAQDVFLGPVFNDLREKLWRGEMPFPEVCQRCLSLRCDMAYDTFPQAEPRIEKFQIEPSYKCTLDCPGCIPLRTRIQAPAQNLDPRVLEHLLGDLVGAGVGVESFEFQGHGEPLLHPDLWGLARRAREAYPESFVTVTTNAQGKVNEQALNAGLDEVVCSIDGVDQESYEVYRVGGGFDLAYRFLADFARGSSDRGLATRVVWKYVLFNHNSEPEQLLEAQRLAGDAGIDEIVFVFTRNGPRSETVLQPSEIPLLPESEGGVPVRSDFHQPETEDLERRLREARQLLEDGEETRAVDLVSSIGENFARFFPDEASLEGRHRVLLGELLGLAEELGPSVRRRADSQLVSLGLSAG